MGSHDVKETPRATLLVVCVCKSYLKNTRSRDSGMMSLSYAVQAHSPNLTKQYSLANSCERHLV